MSFSQQIKLEIIDNKPYRQRAELAQAYGLFLLSPAFAQGQMTFSTELLQLRQLYIWFLRRILGKSVKINIDEQVSRGKTLYKIVMPEQHDREKLRDMFSFKNIDDMLKTDAELDAFCAGAFMACGSMGNPNRAYHLEFAVREKAIADKLRSVIEMRMNIQPGLTARRTYSIIYIKDSEQIQDLLTIMGASRASLALIDIEMIKEVRNRANRVTNCETANIDKLVVASSRQVEDISLVLEVLGEQGISEVHLSAAKLRLKYPEVSLRELCELSPEPVSRSGMHHRYTALAKMAAQIRENEG